MDAGKNDKLVRVVELFAGVGGFRIGLEGASDAYRTVWNNQWEPSTKRQDASLVYQARFGSDGHSNKDISSVKTDDIPDHDLLVGGFPCQNYSVAATLSKSGGIEGKKGVLWWQIYRILEEKGDRRPDYLFFENVDRLLNSPATQRGRDFAIILASLSDLGYVVEWRVINAADYGMPQRRRRTYIMGYKKGSAVERQISDAEEWMMYDDSQEYFCDITPTKVYYTGKTRSFPSTIALNKLYYFMPYIKGKGVRDIYLIRVARIGSKAEVHKDSPDKEPRLVFDLEYLESLPQYKPVRLSIFNTYTDTLLGRVLDA